MIAHSSKCVKSERTNLHLQSSNFCSSPQASVKDKVFLSPHYRVRIYSLLKYGTDVNYIAAEGNLQTYCPIMDFCHERTLNAATSSCFDPLTFCCWSFFGCLVMGFGGATPIFADLKDSRRFLMVLWKISCTSFSSWLTSKRVRLYL